MTCRRLGSAIITSLGDPGCYRIQVDGKIFIFQFSKRFGPLVQNKSGVILENQPGPRHKFWWAVSSWAQHGKQTDEDGLCVWFTETESIIRHMAGRHYEWIGETEAVRGK